MTDDEFDELGEKIREQRGEVRDYLASEGVDVSSWDETRAGDPEADREPADSD